MIALVVLALIAALAIASDVYSYTRRVYEAKAFTAEIDALKKVGSWYESRVEELENETRQLAEQIVAGGGIRQHAMPLPPAELAYEYASDPTGIVVERLDPREAL